MGRANALALLLSGVLFSCSSCENNSQKSVETKKAPESPQAERQTHKAEFSSPDYGVVSEVVAGALALAQRDKRQLIVYVGASWCEPCEYFAGALNAGSLPKEFDGWRFLKFDHDKDEARLEESGYGGEMIPRFVIPRQDGRGSERRFEGAVKGPEAVGYLTTRLRALVERTD
ncbi:MAG: thioredoxin [Kofleriaceae bacterium]|nr:thioredoxin [Kofleriaceae bacterium]